MLVSGGCALQRIAILRRAVEELCGPIIRLRIESNKPGVGWVRVIGAQSDGAIGVTSVPFRVHIEKDRGLFAEFNS